MIDNTQDKGNIMIGLKEIGDDLHICDISFWSKPADINFYVHYESQTIYIDWNDGSPKKVIGHYETVATTPLGVKVYNDDYDVIGWVGEELIFFRSANGDSRECLAFYTRSGRITPRNDPLGTVGLINGSEIGGAAAFVALFFRYDFKSVYRDYLVLDDVSFNEKYASYLNPFTPL